MPAKHVFEYAVLRLVPQVEREEFLNVGVILYCRDKKYLDCLLCDNLRRVTLLFPGLDPAEVREHLVSIKNICTGGSGAGEIGMLDMASRFRWLTAVRSTVIQLSGVHPGLTDQPAATLQKLYEKLVS